MKTIGERIKNKRKELGLTQAELAQKLNVTDRAVSKWEVDEGNPDFSILPNLADVLGVTLDYLIKGKEPIKEEVVMSRMEYVCKKHDVNGLKELRIYNPDKSDETGHNLYDYIEKYNVPEFLNEISPGMSYNSFIRLALKFDNVSALEKIGVFEVSGSPTSSNYKYGAMYNKSNAELIGKEGYKAPKILKKFFSLHEKRYTCYLNNRVVRSSPNYANSDIDCITPYNIATKEAIKTNNKEIIAAVLPYIIDFNKQEAKRCDNKYLYDSYDRYYRAHRFYNVRLAKDEIMSLLKLGLIEEARHFNSIAKSDHKVEDNQFEKYTIINSGKKPKQDLRLLDVMKGPFIIIERLIATNDNEFIIKCLNEYPTNSIELVDKLFAKKDKKKIYEFLVDNNLDYCAREMLTEGLVDDVVKKIEKEIIGYPREEIKKHSIQLRRGEKRDGAFCWIDNINAKYNKEDLLTKYKSKIDLEKFYAGKDETSYYSNLLKKDNVKEAVLELCKLLETKLNSFGINGEDLSEKLSRYLDSKWPTLEDDGWGYMVPAKRPEICDLLHRLRIMRNNYLHAEIKDGKPLNKEKILKCAEFIINKMEK